MPRRSPRSPADPRLVLALAGGLALASFGCKSAAEHRANADREVYSILEKRRASFDAHPESFTIEPPEGSLRERLLSGEVASVGPVTLQDALEVAAENSREYQRRKEQLYLVALDLTLERYRFRLQPSAVLEGKESGTELDATASGGGTLGFSRLLGSGAKIVSDLGLKLVRDLSRADGWNLVTDLGFTFTQPLLRGSGKRIVIESLTQAERDVVYEVRSFERFRRTFAVDVATRLYRVLQEADTVANERANQANLEVLRQRNEALAEAGRLSDIQVDQARQDELRAKNSVIEAEQRYEGLLDDFKLFLGLPVEADLTLDPMELSRLDVEQEPTPFDEASLVALALSERLDYLTSLDQVDDARRKVLVAEDALRADLGLEIRADESSPEGRPAEFHTSDIFASSSLTLDLPIDRFTERNGYRASLVRWQATERDAVELADQIRADLRDALRQREATLETWRIQLRAVELAERRVESTRLNLEAGRASTRDILEAQEALLEAKNAAIRAQVDYHLALLALYTATEALRVDESGIAIEREMLESARPPEPEATP